MKRALLCLVLFTLVPTFATAESAAADSKAKIDFAAVFEQLKGLAGTWEGRSEKNRVRVTYHTTGGGSALVESFYSTKPDTPSTMSSVYHMDGDRLMVTHYCGAGNQPRMRAVSQDPETGAVKFEFMDITNLSEPDAYHTREVVLTLEDEDHLRVEFNGVEKGEPIPARFALTRSR